MEAEMARKQAVTDAEALVTQATGRAEAAVREANETAVKTRREAHDKAREMLRGARQTAGEVRADGAELVSDFQELSESLRSNADRLLRDIISIHSNMLAQIDRVDPDHGLYGDAAVPAQDDTAVTADARPRRSPFGVHDTEHSSDLRRVPEFIPPD